MVTLSFTTGSALISSIAFSGTTFYLTSLLIMVKKNAKDMIWCLRNFKLEINGMTID